MEYCLDCKRTFETWVMNYPIRQLFKDQLIHAPCLVVLLNEIAGCDMFSLNIETVGEDFKIETEGVGMRCGERTDTVGEEEDIKTVTVDEHEGELSNHEDIFLSLEDLGDQEN